MRSKSDNKCRALGTLMVLVCMTTVSYDRYVSYLLDGLERGQSGRSQEASTGAGLPGVMATGIESEIF